MSLNKVTVRSPTRVDLAGGTLDMWPLYNFVSNAQTINVAINIWTEATIQELTEKKLVWESVDLNIKLEYPNLTSLIDAADKNSQFFKVIAQYWQSEIQNFTSADKGLHIKTSSESPVGGGLGGSSSLTISILKAFEKFFGVQRFSDVHHLVNVAHHIEAEILNTPTGTQDYYPACVGGLNVINYSKDGIKLNTLKTSGSELEKYFLLVHTGKAHHSGLNNFEVLEKAVKKDPLTLEALRQLKMISEKVVDVISTQKFNKLPELFNQEYHWRIKLASAFSSPEIERLQKVTLQAGADAVKICGAGGGGCILVWVTPAKQKEVIEVCQREGFKILSAKPIDPL